MKRIYVASPLRSATPDGVEVNIARARRLCLLAMLNHDVAPFAPHAFYTEFLDDNNLEERELGIWAGQVFLDVCNEIWVYTKAGITGGMRSEIETAKELGIPVITNPPCWESVDA